MEGPSLYESIPKILESLDYDILWAYNSQYDSNVLTEALYTSGFFPYPHKMGDKVICDALPFISLAGKIYPKTIKTPEEIKGPSIDAPNKPNFLAIHLPKIALINNNMS